MGWSDSFQDHHDEVHNKGSIAHDAIAGAIAFTAISAYEKHLEKSGKPDNHATAKKILGGFVAAAATHLAETKGRDLWDEHKKKKALDQASVHIEETVLTKEYN